MVFKPLSKYYVQQLAIGHCQLIIADTAAVVCLNFYNFLQTKTYFYCVFLHSSRQFGFLKLRGNEHGRTRALVLKAVKYLEGMLVQVKV